jgi:hypothetical protein
MHKPHAIANAAARDSTSNAGPGENWDGIAKIDEVRASLSGAIALIDEASSDEAQDACILLKRAVREARIVRLLFEGFSLKEAESEMDGVENDIATEAANG